MTSPLVASVTPLPPALPYMAEAMAAVTVRVASGALTAVEAAERIVDDYGLDACHPGDPSWDRAAAIANVAANIEGNIRLAEKALAEPVADLLVHVTAPVAEEDMEQWRYRMGALMPDCQNVSMAGRRTDDPTTPIDPETAQKIADALNELGIAQ